MRRFRHSVVIISSLSVLQPMAAYAQAPAPSKPAAPAPAEEDAVEDAEEAAPAEGAPNPPAEKAPENGAEAAPDEAEAVPDDAAMDAEMAEEDPARPPTKGKGVIWGVVSESADNEPTMEATVTVVGTKLKTTTDMDGRFRLELPPGTYRLRFFYELHKPLRFDDVHVEAGKISRLDAKLETQEDAIDTVEIETDATRSTIEGEILTRQRAAAVGDSVGRVEIAKTPDKNAAQAAQRVVGATIVGGRFVYVRGLGERYTNALLNGAPLPSPEPDRAAIPLDIFPTLVLDSITIAKTFTPDAPGDFAGGSVRVETREIPSKLLFQVSATGGYNTQSTFRDRLSYQGGSLDWLGIDDGSRALPSGFPKQRLDQSGTLSNEQLDAAGRSINSYFRTTKGASTPPDHSISVVAGNGWKVGETGKLGVLAALNYGRSYVVRRDEVFNDYTFDSSDRLLPSATRRIVRGSKSVNWGGFGSVSYRFNSDHKLTIIGLRTQLSDNSVQIADGGKTNSNSQVHDASIRFVTRALDLVQLTGEHNFASLGKAKLDWAGWLSRATRTEPDTRSVAFSKSNVGGDYALIDDSYSGRHFWSDQSERGVGGKVDWTQPLSVAQLKLGMLASERSRDFDARTITLRPSSDLPLRDRAAALSCPSGDFDACADRIFTNDNIGPVVRPNESTLPVDAYQAKLGVYAGYVMADMQLAKPLRVILGERVEVTRQNIDPFNQFDPTDHPPGGAIKSTDVLPSLSVIVDTSKRTKLRGSLTRTLARPQLRELAPFAYTEFYAGSIFGGNPNLKLTHITNADLRLEFFPTLREVLAVSGFYKSFQDPIETVSISAGDGGLITFANAAGGKLYGAELEARKSLEFLSDKLKDFSLIANLTLAKSTVELVPQAGLNLTNPSRAMMNQAPYVLNIAADYSNTHGTIVRVLYNVVGSRIVQVGTQGLPDAYEHPRHLLDITFSQELSKNFQAKLQARNILNSESLVTQGEKSGGGNVVSRYKDGAVYSLTATYTY